MAQTMKAWQYSSVTGGMEKNMHINEIAARPTPSNDEILVQVHAMALNPVDYKITESGAPLRLFGSTFIPGSDFCGKVSAVGKKVDEFQVGEMVFGAKIGLKMLCHEVTHTETFVGEITNGSLAQYTTVKKHMAISLPSGIKPEDAAAVTLVGLTETQAIRPNVKSGDKVFINGGSGGTGSYGIQIAKALGCHVTATCSTSNVQMCKKLGADEVIDYKSSDVVSALSDQGPTFSLVVDNIGTPANLYQKSPSFIAPDGKFVQIGAAPSLSGITQVSSNMLWPGFLGGGKAKYQMMMAQAAKSDLQMLSEWIKEGKVKGVLDSVFEWEDAAEAYEKLKNGRTKGKIVVKVPVDE